MRIQTTSFTLIAAFGLLGCGKATQPKPVCRAQQSEYAAHYVTAEKISGDCTDKELKTEIFHLAYYRSDPTGGIPKLGIESAAIGDAVAHAEEHEPPVEVTGQQFSLGSFKAALPDDNDICIAPTLSDADVTIPEIPGDPTMMIDATPAVALKYKWSNVKFITQPLSNAIHFGADLERTDGDCVMKYKVSAINPVIHCGDGKKMVDTEEIDPATMMPKLDPATGKPVQVEVDDPETGMPVESACDPSEIGAPEGSGLSPDYDYECEPTTLLCVPTKAFPARAK